MATAGGDTSAALFGKFKTEVADQFKKDDAVKVAVCLGLTPAKRDEINQAQKPGLALLNYLQDDDIIREDNIQRLCDALAHCHLKRAARIAKEEFDKYKSKKEMEAGGQPPSTDYTDTGSISYDLGTLKGILQDDLTRVNCYELAIYFSLPDQVVNTIKESRNYAKELLETLENRTVISEGNISALLMALKDRGLLRVVNKIKASCEQHHVVTHEEDGPATHEEGSGDLVKCKICGTSRFQELKYGDEIVALECQNEDCLSHWVNVPTSSSETASIKYGNQKLSYKPPGKLDLSKMKYEEVTDIKGLKSGDHIIFRRSILYDHHAILVSIKESQKLEVIHWTSGWPSFSSIIRRKSDATVTIRKEEIDFPSRGVKRAVYDREEPTKLVLARAFKLLQNSDESYKIIENNCESLATYCKSGVFYSVQGQLLNKYRPLIQKVMSSVSS